MSLHLSVSRPLSVSLTASRSLCVRSLKPSIWADICLSLGCYWALCSLLAAIAYALDFSYGSPFIYLCSIWKTKQYMLICFCWPLLLEPIGWCPIWMTRLVYVGCLVYNIWYICYCWWFLYMLVYHMDDPLVVVMLLSIFYCWFLLVVWFLYHLIYMLLLVDMKNIYIIWTLVV